MSNNRYILKPSDNVSGAFVCSDTESGLVCTFRKGAFNEDQRFTWAPTSSAEPPSAQALAALCSLMGDWLGAYHYDLVFGVKVPARFVIGRQVSFLRRLKGLTLQDLADASGINKANLSKIENGKYNVSVDLLDRIAAALGAAIEIE